MVAGPTAGRLTLPVSRRRRLRLALGLVGLPLVIFGVPAAFGLPWITGDNLLQNFPLRALVGTDLRHGHLPLWDPYIWSGTPLLGGFNAGAAYPFTWLFAVLGRVPAWVTQQVAVEAVAASGMFVFLRGQRRSTVASAAGAGAFAYGGFVAIQTVHLDLVQAAGWLVWAFVALDRMARRQEGASVLPWVALLGASLGLMVLTGATEPLLDGGVALVLYTAWLVARTRRRVSLAVGAVSGAVLGVLIGAAQLLPGSALQSESQRAAHSFTYFASGSMNKSLTVLLLDPLLLGGIHSTPLGYIGTYNLPEISGYVGILPVMAAVGLLAKRHRRNPEAREWWIWYVIAAVGLVLVWGSFTPLGHLEHLIPLYNRQRLLARNWLEVDLALAVLFAIFVDHMLMAPRPPLPGATSRWRRWPSDVVLPLLPVVAVVGLQVVMLAGGPWFPHFIHVSAQVSYGRLWVWGLLLTVPSAIAVAAGWLVVRAPAMVRRVPTVLALVVAADLLFFNGLTQLDPQWHTAADATAGPANTLVRVVDSAPGGPGGLPPRFAMFDPDRYDVGQTNEVGQADLNALRQVSSIQGYGALVDARYEAATATHLQTGLSIDALRYGVLQGVDLGVLLTLPQYFVHLVVVAPGVADQRKVYTLLPPVPPDRRVGPDPAPAPPTPVKSLSQFVSSTGPVSLDPGAPRTLYFGTVLAAARVTVPLSSPSATAQLRVGLLSPSGTNIRWLEGPTGASVRGHLQVTVPSAPGSAGIVVESVGSPVSVEPPVVATAGQGTYRLDGGLRDLLTPPVWHWSGPVDGFGVFEESPSGAATLEPVGGGTAVVRADPPWGSAAVEVRANQPVTLVRNEEFAAGWQATVTSVSGGAGRAVKVERHGLLQAVPVPAGDHLVVFRYQPHRVVEGLAVSACGVLVAIGLVIAGRRRARRGPGPDRRDVGARPEVAASVRAPGGAAPGP